MIYDIQTQIIIIILLTAFGIFLIASYDIFYYVVDFYQPSRLIRALAELVFGVVQILIAYRYSYNICEGYIPIYFFLFFALGVVIYLKLLKGPLKKDLPIIMKILNYLVKQIGKLFVFLFYSKEVAAFCKKVIKGVKKITKELINKMGIQIRKLFKKRDVKETKI